MLPSAYALQEDELRPPGASLHRRWAGRGSSAARDKGAGQQSGRATPFPNTDSARALLRALVIGGHTMERRPPLRPARRKRRIRFTSASSSRSMWRARREPFSWLSRRNGCQWSAVANPHNPSARKGCVRYASANIGLCFSPLSGERRLAIQRKTASNPCLRSSEGARRL